MNEQKSVARKLSVSVPQKFKYLRHLKSHEIIQALNVITKRRITKFDLPKLVRTRSSRFQYLKSKIWRRSLVRPKHWYVCDIALERLHQDIVRRLSIIYDVHTCQSEIEVDETFPNRLYSWDLDDFLKRRQLDTIWIDVLKVQITSKCFRDGKFKCDLDELRRYLRLMFNFYAERHEDPFLKAHFFTYMEETQNLLDYEENFFLDLKENKQKFADIASQFININFSPNRDTKHYAYKLFIEDVFMSSDVYNPIELRYQVRYYHNREKECENKCGSAEEKLQSEIERYKSLAVLEQRCMKYLMTFYNNEIEGFKDRINMLSTTFDIEYEKIEIVQMQLRSKVEKVREQHKFLDDHLNRLKGQYAQMLERERLQELKRQSENRRNREQSEANKLAKAMKKAKLLEKKKAAKKKGAIRFK